MPSTTTAHACTGAAVLLVLLSAAPVAGQQQADRAVEIQSYRIPGWSFTPSIAIGTTYDSNVALSSPQASVGDTQGDTVFNIVPAGQLKYLGKHSEFTTGYGGFFRRYQGLEGLDEFAQRATVSFTRTMSRHLKLEVRDYYADSPTTDDVEVNGVPFRRAGSQTNTFTASAESRFTKLTTLSSRYDATWVAFDQEEPFLSGGWIHSISNDLSRALTGRMSLGAEYSYRTASINDGDRDLSFQDAGAVLRLVVGRHTSGSVSGGLGVLTDRNLDKTRKGPYVRLGLTHQLEHATVSAGFSRHYVPTFGFGGASSSQELRGSVLVPLARNKMYSQASVTWRQTSPFEENVLPLDSLWLRSTVGYAVNRWARVEGLYTYTLQDSIITGGEVDRHRVGVQMVISQPIRMH